MHNKDIDSMDGIRYKKSIRSSIPGELFFVMTEESNVKLHLEISIIIKENKSGAFNWINLLCN